MKEKRKSNLRWEDYVKRHLVGLICGMGKESEGWGSGWRRQ